MSDSRRILAEKEMRAQYGSFFKEGGNVKLDPHAIPEKFRILMPYVAFWGISDDCIRDELCYRAPRELMRNFVDVWMPFDAPLDEWLADPAEVESLTDEYCAYASARMAADYCSSILDRGG